MSPRGSDGLRRRDLAGLWRRNRFFAAAISLADRPIVASFAAQGWKFEIFGQARPVAEQAGWRHFRVERRLVALGGAGFHAAVMGVRRGGVKTEPAFAALLGLKCDPYLALLDLDGRSDAALAALLRRAGFPAPEGCTG